MTVTIRHLGLTDYEQTLAAMQTFTAKRDADTADELWLTQHYPVFTQGQAGKPEHVLMPGDIPVVQSDRGGQVTYHGPGQVVLYFLLDIKRARLGVRQVVSLIEQTVIATLAHYHIDSFARADAPGVYLKDNGEKIASLGLRVRNGRTYHGVALNVAMDLSPFQRINPCGYQGLVMTQLSDLIDCDIDAVSHCLLQTAQVLLSSSPLPSSPSSRLLS